MKKLGVILAMSLWMSGALAEVSGTPASREQFFQTHGFVFFFASTCPYCHQFSPVLSQVSTALHARVLPLSFDNVPLPEFKEVMPATSDWVTAAFQNEAIHYPALFIANPKTLELYPVSIGALTEVELTTRILELVPKIIAHESSEVRV